MTRREVMALWASAVVAQGSDWQKTEAYQRIYNLDYDAAVPLLKEQAARTPNDPEVWNHLAYGLLYQALFAADALDASAALNVSSFLRKPKVPFEEASRRAFEIALDKSISLSKSRLEKNPNEAISLYTLGVAEVHRASYLFLMQKEWRAALKAGGEARRLHTDAYKNDPALVDALLVPRVHEYVVGSLPIYLKALGFLVGFSGDKSKGIEGLRTVATQGQRSKIEAQVLLAVAEEREEHLDVSVKLLRELCAAFPSNHLYRMELVKVLAKRKRREEAQQELKALTDSRYRFLKAEKLNSFRLSVEPLLKA